MILNYKGRLCQHLTETAGFNLDSTLLFVLDEADRMLDMGFKTQIDRIISYLPKVTFHLQILSLSWSSTKIHVRPLNDIFRIDRHYCSQQLKQRKYLIWRD